MSTLQQGYHIGSQTEIWNAGVNAWNEIDKNKSYRWEHSQKDYEVDKIRRALANAGYRTSYAIFAKSNAFSLSKLLILTKESWTESDVQAVLKVVKDTLKDLKSYAAHMPIKYIYIAEDSKEKEIFYYLDNALEDSNKKVEENTQLIQQVEEYLKNKKSGSKSKDLVKPLYNKISKQTFYGFEDIERKGDSVTVTLVGDQIQNVARFTRELESEFDCDVRIGTSSEIKFTDNGTDEPDYFYEYPITFTPKDEPEPEGYEVNKITKKKAEELAAILDEALRKFKKFKSHNDYESCIDAIITRENLKKWLPNVYIGQQAAGNIHWAMRELDYRTRRYRKMKESKLFERILRESQLSSWEDYYDELKSLAQREEDADSLVAALNDIDEVHDRNNGFKYMNESDREIIEYATDNLYYGSESFCTLVNEMCEHFGLDNLWD